MALFPARRDRRLCRLGERNLCIHSQSAWRWCRCRPEKARSDAAVDPVDCGDHRHLPPGVADIGVDSGVVFLDQPSVHRLHGTLEQHHRHARTDRKLGGRSRVDRDPLRDLRGAKRQIRETAATAPGCDADHAYLRLPDTGLGVVRFRKTFGSSRDNHLRGAAHCPPHQPGHSTSRPPKRWMRPDPSVPHLAKCCTRSSFHSPSRRF